MADLLVAGFLWLLFSLPVITIGPASCALYYTVVKVVRRKRETVWKAFWYSFRSNLRQGLLVTVCCLLYGGIFLWCSQVADAVGGYQRGLVTAMAILALPFLLILPWIFPVISRFQAGLVRQLQYAVYMAVGHFPTTLALLAMLAVVILLVVMFPFLLAILPGIYTYAASFLTERVMRSYMKQELEKYAGQEDLPWYLE